MSDPAPPTPPSLAEWKRRRTPLRRVSPELKQKLKPLEKLAVWITERVGTMGFFFIILTWTVLWLSWNLLAPRSLQFDPPTAFVFWLFISNMIQILLMPLIMVGQNVQGKYAEAREEHDLEINVRAEKEIEMILNHLEYQNGLLLEMMRKLDASVGRALDDNVGGTPPSTRT